MGVTIVLVSVIIIINLLIHFKKYNVVRVLKKFVFDYFFLLLIFQILWSHFLEQSVKRMH